MPLDDVTRGVEAYAELKRLVVASEKVVLLIALGVGPHDDGEQSAFALHQFDAYHPKFVARGCRTGNRASRPQQRTSSLHTASEESAFEPFSEFMRSGLQ